MKRIYQRSGSVLLCLSLCAGLLSGCGTETPVQTKQTDPAVTQTTEIIPDETEGESRTLALYLNNDENQASLELRQDNTVIYSDSFHRMEGTYTLVGEVFRMELEGEHYTGRMDGLNLLLEGCVGIFFGDDFILYQPAEETTEQWPSEHKEYTALDDTHTRYYDYNGDLAVSYPDWMTNWEDALLPGSILLDDGEDGYVLCMNVSEELWSFRASADKFVRELYENEIASAFRQLYGEGEMEITMLPAEEEGQISLASANIWNEDCDMEVFLSLYRPLEDGEMTQTVIAAVYFAPFGEDARMEKLWAAVTDCTGAVLP